MSDNSEKYHALRRRYPVFEYQAWHWKVTDEGLRLWFDFKMGEVEFHPSALVERRGFLHMEPQGISEQLDRLVFDIGMVELVSYWKCACPPRVVVSCGSLTHEQVAFWKKLYWNGLGEFFYTNSLTPNPSPVGEGSELPWMTIELLDSTLLSTPLSHRRDTPPFVPPRGGMGGEVSYLVPIGGGKDSVVTLELLRKAGKQIRPLIMNPRGATVECARVAGFPMDEVMVIRRTIDPTLLELNKQGYLNGHTPFSAMLAFYTRLASALTGIPNVALSNESSANESTVLGTSVNHQYSKSLEFENDFRRFCSLPAKEELPTTHYPLPTYNYFSFLRPLSELQIAMLFSRFTDYHPVFRSCNVGSKQDIWCGHCAKCLFAYIILSPFIAPDRLAAIFGKNMLDDPEMQTEFEQLTGKAETKPFECVGTVDEVNTALSMTVERWYPDARPRLLAEFCPVPEASRVSLHGLLSEGNLSNDERNILLQCIENSN